MAVSFAFFGYSVPLLAVMLVITRGFAYGMTKPAVDALYTRVPRETRYKGKNFVETAVWRFGDVRGDQRGQRPAHARLGHRRTGPARRGRGHAGGVVSRRAGWSPDLAPDEHAPVGAEAKAAA